MTAPRSQRGNGVGTKTRNRIEKEEVSDEILDNNTGVCESEEPKAQKENK